MKTNGWIILICVVVGLSICGVVIWISGVMLSNSQEVLYAGQSSTYWLGALNSHTPAASNEALGIINAKVVPQLADTLLHDTNDSELKLALIKNLDSLPGIQISFIDADGRREIAALRLGELGSAAEAAIPSLVKSLKQDRSVIVDGKIMLALGKIRGDPDEIIPLLTGYLGNGYLKDKAATALGDFGRLSSNAIPGLLKLSSSDDKDARLASREALRKIDPDGALRKSASH